MAKKTLGKILGENSNFVNTTRVQDTDRYLHSELSKELAEQVKPCIKENYDGWAIYFEKDAKLYTVGHFVQSPGAQKKVSEILKKASIESGASSKINYNQEDDKSATKEFYNAVKGQIGACLENNKGDGAIYFQKTKEGEYELGHYKL